MAAEHRDQTDIQSDSLIFELCRKIGRNPAQPNLYGPFTHAACAVLRCTGKYFTSEARSNAHSPSICVNGPLD